MDSSFRWNRYDFPVQNDQRSRAKKNEKNPFCGHINFVFNQFGFGDSSHNSENSRYRMGLNE